MRTLLALPAGTPSLRLLADETAKVLYGMLHVLDGLALLVGAPDQPAPGYRGFSANRRPIGRRLLVNAARAFVAIGAVELFWVVTAWPNGATAVVFAAIVICYVAEGRSGLRRRHRIRAWSAAVGVPCAAIIKFAVLPGARHLPGLLRRHRAFPRARWLCRWPMSRQPALAAVFSCMAFNFMPLLAPTNQMSYDTEQFYNTALSIFVGCSVAPLAFLLLPPLSPALRTRRLLALDLARLASSGNCSPCD